MPCESVNAVIAALEIVNGSLCNFLDPFTSDRSCNPNALVAFSLLLLQLLGSWRVTRLCGSVIPMSQRLRHLQVQVLEASCPNLCPENQSVSEAEEISWWPLSLRESAWRLVSLPTRRGLSSLSATKQQKTTSGQAISCQLECAISTHWGI